MWGQVVDVTAETSCYGLYPPLLRAIESSHRLRLQAGRKRSRVEVDSDHDQCYLIVEVMDSEVVCLPCQDLA